MRTNEAKTISRVLANMPDEDLDPLLNLGSSTRNFRICEQPHIDAEIFAPLRKRGVTIIHADMKAADGVDLVGDVYDPEYRARILKLSPGMVLCSNMLEHLEDREGFVAMCDKMLNPKGTIFFTVPLDYPYHQDPIDTYYRPRPEEIAGLLPGYEVIWSEIVEDTCHKDDFKMLSGREKLRQILSLWKAPVLYFTDRKRFLSRYHRWAWWNRPFRVSCILLRKPARYHSGEDSTAAPLDASVDTGHGPPISRR